MAEEAFCLKGVFVSKGALIAYQLVTDRALAEGKNGGGVLGPEPPTRPAAGMGARGPEGPSGDHRCCEAAAVVDERSEFEGPKGPRTSLKSEQLSGRLPVPLYISLDSARNPNIYALIWSCSHQ